jgi:hypothetical protein
MKHVLRRSELAWAVLGIVLVTGMYHAYAVWGAIAMFTAIGMAFVIWYKMSPKGAWIAVAVVGMSMATLLGLQAATSSRCPTGTDRVSINAGEMPDGTVSCDELRASALSMAAFFAFIGIMGLAAPWYLRTRDEDTDEDAPSPPAPVTL